ncbi:LysR family transcriptional regulator [Agarivorans gilvus]|jgi:DNA-binding transcriptional LysR family regulator|uniref:LysR family transcriptional regulator n=1 Tax=Agarivorans gilvus TaxID=680279 RepID=A0ABQ1HY00_9ALTE|nr:LysR family transcriptional regulator [Agarivorans gilvus]GGA97493.1 LysR family transcriptional regulator [Agarivorans gilvus]
MKTEDIKLFHFIVDAGNLTKASELLDLPKSNLSRRLKNLENELQVKLFHRDHREITLSKNGRLFYQRSKSIINELEFTVESLVKESVELSAQLRVHLLPLPGIDLFENIIFRFMEMHPKVAIEIITSSDERDLIEHNIDVALRVGASLEDSNLIARQLKTVKFGYYASPEYLAIHGIPRTEEELMQHQFIIHRQPNGKLAKRFPLCQGRSFEAKGRLIVNDFSMLVRACLGNQGLVYQPHRLVEAEVDKGHLVHLLPETDSRAGSGWLVYPTRTSLSPAARALIDYLVKEVDHIFIEC